MKKQSPIIKILLFPINLLKYEVLGIYYTLYALLYPFIFIFNKIGDKAYSKYEENARKNSGVKEMVEEEVDRLMHRYEEQLKMQGISLDLYYQFKNSKMMYRVPFNGNEKWFKLKSKKSNVGFIESSLSIL